MTRVIIFGDLHANWEALLALQQAEPRPDGVLCLGDLVGYGPDPKRCLDAVRAGVTHLIGGRHDTATGAGSGQEDGGELLEATWAHTRLVLPSDDRDYLALLPGELTVEIAGTRFFLTRLAPDDVETETQMLITMPQARLKELFGDVEADVILLGGPRYGVPDPTFAAWEDGRVQVHHLHYHPEDTIRKLSLLPLAPEHVLGLGSILRTGGLE
jgi:predicted phosphodiesterase